MTNQTDTNQYAVGGSAIGAASKDEMEKADAIIYAQPGLGMKELGTQMYSSLEWQYNAFSDPERATKYQSDPDVIIMGNGSFSIAHSIGKFVFANSENEASVGAMRLDQKSSTLYSSAGSTTLGSTNIDTVNGYEMNPLDLIFPSTHFSPVKTWVKRLFPVLCDKRFYQIALLEALQVMLLRTLKGTKTEQNSKETSIDLGTIIVDNQELEDKILLDARS